MLVKDILNTEISPLKLDDTVAVALSKMNALRLTKFGVVDSHNRLVGMISLAKLVEVVDVHTPLSEIELSDPIHVLFNQHLFEVARMMVAKELFVLPVVDGEMIFQGVVRKRELLMELSDAFNLSSFGSVITVELGQADFMLSDLVRIIEAEGAKILGVAVQQPNANNSFYRISFKLNLNDSSVVSAGLRRFGYIVTSEANSEALEGDYSDRADELIRYLDI
ncbi:MAG: CBS domain-containing protein [Balneolaceae bacterium]